MKPMLSPKELAQAIGVSESSLKRWADEGLVHASRTGGGHRRITITEAIRFIRETRSPLVRPEILGLPDVGAALRDTDAGGEEQDRLYEYLHAGAAAEARGLLLSMYLTGADMADIVDGPIHGAMERLGKLYEHDQAGVFVEHRATDICIQAVSQLRLMVQPPAGAPVAIGGAPEDDPYLLPSQCVAAVLTSAGYRCENLGPDTPQAAMLAAIENRKADLIWLSVSVRPKGVTLARFIESLSRAIETRPAWLLMGGRAMDHFRPPSLPNLFLGDTMREMAAFVQGLSARPDGNIDPPH